MSLAFLHPLPNYPLVHCLGYKPDQPSSAFFRIRRLSLPRGCHVLPRGAVSLFTSRVEVESKRSIGERQPSKFSTPSSPVRDIISLCRYFIYFRNTLVPRSRRRFLTILSGLLISNGIVVIGPRNVLIECLTRARTHTRRRARRRPVRCPFCMRKSYTPREVKFGSGPRCRSAERVSGLETR